MSRRTLRCAIYTRKSSEEGLEQEFNSLQAQREACEAYIASQRHEGWKLVSTPYDDGGYSGGTLDRPALQQLLADVGAGTIDVIVVYKVDRLTRALSDFARIVEIFDGKGVSFVSVTQQFNTTTSMGRLTLNVLLSFAQFEREVTGERIRDKIAASKKKGMWMGGYVPLGYDLRDRRLVINEAEAEVVRTVYRLYLEHGNVRLVQREADLLRLRTKARPDAADRITGSRPLSRGYIYKLLGNPLYVGRIRHGDQVHDGQHEPIVDLATWEAVRTQLAGNAVARRQRTNAAEASLLAGLLHDGKGRRYTASHAQKGNKRYRYYINRAALAAGDPHDGSVARIPAREIEALVVAELGSLLRDAPRLSAELDDRLDVATQQRLQRAATEAARCCSEKSSRQRQALILAVVTRVTAERDVVTIALSKTAMRDFLVGGALNGKSAQQRPVGISSAVTDILELRVQSNLRRIGGASRLILSASGESATPQEHRALIKAIVRAQTWKEQLFSGAMRSLRDVALQEGCDERYIGQILPLAFLSPALVAAVLSGEQPPLPDLGTMARNVPLAWRQQGWSGVDATETDESDMTTIGRLLPVQ